MQLHKINTPSKRPSPSQHSILWANFLEFAVLKEDGEAVFYVEFISAQDGGGGFRVGQENTFGYDVSEILSPFDTGCF